MTGNNSKRITGQNNRQPNNEKSANKKSNLASGQKSTSNRPKSGVLQKETSFRYNKPTVSSQNNQVRHQDREGYTNQFQAKRELSSNKNKSEKIKISNYNNPEIYDAADYDDYVEDDEQIGGKQFYFVKKIR